MTTPPYDPLGTPTGQGTPSGAPSPYAGTPDYGQTTGRPDYSQGTLGGSPTAFASTPYGAPYPVTPGYGVQPGPPPKKTLGVWALVLGWLPCLMGWIGCVVLTIMVFSRSRPGADHGKKLAVIGLAGIAFYALVIGAVFLWSPFAAHRDAAGHVTSGGDVVIDGMRVGDCGSHAPEGMTTTVHLVPCSDPHSFEVMATFELAGARYPGDDVVSRVSEGGCVKRLRRMAALAGRNDVSLALLHPVSSTWARQKTVVCLVKFDHPVTGSLSGR